MGCIGSTKRRLTSSEYALIRQTISGISRSDETKEKISRSHQGINVYSSMSPERYKEVCIKHSEVMKGVNTWMKGRVWWTNDIVEIQCEDCPGEKWRRGRLFRKDLSQKIRKKLKSRTQEEITLWKERQSKSQKGYICFNNGIINKRFKEDPGEGWTKGRLKKRI